MDWRRMTVAKFGVALVMSRMWRDRALSICGAQQYFSIKSCCLVFATSALVLAAIAGADEVPPAGEVFQKLQQNLLADKKRADWNAFLADARHLKSFLHGLP